MRTFCALLVWTAVLMQAAELKVVVPANAAKPVGPYSPGLMAGPVLYVSGQGVRRSDNSMPEGIAEQTRQCMENVKAIVTAGGLTMDDVVYTQVYVDKAENWGEVDKVYASYFTKKRPARENFTVERMPTGTTVEINAIATRDASLAKKVAKGATTAGRGLGLTAKGGGALKPASGTCRVDGNTVYCSAVTAAGADVESQTKAVLTKIGENLSSVGLSHRDIAAAFVQLNNLDDFQKMNGVYATFFAGAPPTRTTVQPFATSADSPLVRISVIAVK